MVLEFQEFISNCYFSREKNSLPIKLARRKCVIMGMTIKKVG